ncbi:esterase [Allostella vacuolata]|nr:esterase [Stella vacuolata]
MDQGGLPFDDELERQFNPRVTVPDFQHYLDRAAAASRAARAECPAFFDVRYGDGPRQSVDVFPADDLEAPVLVFVHGGFWRALGKEQFSGLAATMRPQGIATVLVGYDLCPAVTLDTIVRQVADAVGWCRPGLARLGLRPRRMVLAGSSAGAHLVAMALFGRGGTGVDGACLVSGIYDLAPVLRISVNRDIRLDEDAARRNSPIARVRWLGLPLIVAVGARESPAWRQQSASFARRCIAEGIDTGFIELPLAHHFSTGLAISGSTINRLTAKLCIGQR